MQKSQYGPRYYFNQGFWLTELDDERYPKGSKCHVTLRLETLVVEERHRIAQLLDLDHQMPDERRVGELVAAQGADAAGDRTRRLAGWAASDG